MTKPIDNPKCFANHMGQWLIEENWFRNAVSAVREGTWKAESGDDGGDRTSFVQDGIAVLSISGPMMKGRSKFGGTSTIDFRRELREAVADPAIQGIMVHADSPGGTVAGTEEAANDMRRAAAAKPLRVHADDLMASAMLWVGSQANHITANSTAQIGSIGVVAVLEDSSERMERLGIRVHVISTGAFKGMGVGGAPITSEQLRHVRDLVMNTHGFFLDAVSSGRRMARSAVEAIADGRMFPAAEAKQLGLIDAVMGFDDAFVAFRSDIRDRAERSRKTQHFRRAATIAGLDR